MMRRKTDDLEKKLESSGIGGPVTAGFHRDVAFLLHRVTATTPVAYNQFLKNIIVGYTAVVIYSVPALPGFILTTLIVYVLGGMYLLVEDIDEPLSYEANSHIAVRLDALEFFNKPQ